MNKVSIILLLYIVIFFSSCEKNHYFKSEISFPNQKWAYSEPLIAEFDITSLNQKNDIGLQISYRENYPYQNIYLRITDDFTGKKLVDTITFNLSNKQGFWKGEKDGSTYTYRSILRKNFKFSKAGKYQISIEQFSRVDSLPEIEDIMFFIDENKK